MPTIYKVLGQSNPTAATPTTLYTVPASNSAVISTISATNLLGTGATFRIAVRPGGETLANSQYIAYDTALPPNDSIALTLGITVSNTDVITVQANTGSVSFVAFGSEIY